MRLSPIDLVGGFYKDDTLPWAAQDTLNWLPVTAEVRGTRTLDMLRTPPGLSYFSDVGTGPIRGSHNVEGKLFVVSGNTLFEVFSDGSATGRGTIPGVGRVSMQHNKRGYGNQLLVVNGDSGYVWDTTTSIFAKVTDDGYPGAVQVDYLDHFLIQVEPFGRFWFHSNLDNALDYNTLDRYDAEASPDQIVGIAANQLEAVVFSQRTTEFFTNTGAATGTFQSKRIVIEHGCAGRFTIARLENTLIWLSNDGVVYALNGYAPQRLSTTPIERAMADEDWTNAFAFTWDERGHKVYYLTFPTGNTWGFDMASGLWHRRASFGMNRWRLNTLTLWNDLWIGGDFSSGRLYVLDWDVAREVGQPLISQRTTGYNAANQNRVLCPYVELLFDTGAPDEDISPLAISGDLPGGVIDSSVTFQYAASGGVLPYVFTITAGALPTGLTMNSAGLVTGTLNAVGSFSWTVTVTDAVSSTASLPDTADVTGIDVFIQGSSVATPNIGKSANPISWAGQPTLASGISANHLIIGGGRILSYSNTALQVSTDNGGSFSTVSIPASSAGGYKGIYFGSKYWIPLGSNGLTSAAMPGTWTTVAINTHDDYSIVGKVGLMIRAGLATGGGDGVNCSKSTDGGTVWDAPISGLKMRIGTQSATVNMMATDGTIIVAVGHDHALAYTSDGITWTQIPSPFVNGSGGASSRQLMGVAFGRVNGSPFWVCGSGATDDSPAGQIAFSANGTTWTLATDTLGQRVLDCVVANGIATVIGVSSAIKTSTNGPTWTTRTSNFAVDLTSIVKFAA